jgi:hypothetical protein
VKSVPFWCSLTRKSSDGRNLGPGTVPTREKLFKSQALYPKRHLARAKTQQITLGTKQASASFLSPYRILWHVSEDAKNSGASCPSDSTRISRILSPTRGDANHAA